MGLKPERLDEFRAGKVGFPSVRINADTVIDLFPIEGGRRKQNATEKTAGNLNHFCMVIGKEDFSGIIDYLKENRIMHQRRTGFALGRSRQSDIGLLSRSRWQ